VYEYKVLQKKIVDDRSFSKLIKEHLDNDWIITELRFYNRSFAEGCSSAFGFAILRKSKPTNVKESFELAWIKQQESLSRKFVTSSIN